MLPVLVVSLNVVFAVLALSGGVRTVLGRQPGWFDVIGAGVAELGLVVQAAIAIVLLIGGESIGETATFLAYLGASLLIAPAAMIWAVTEKSRWSNVVLAVGWLSLIVVLVRMQQVWTGA